MANILNRRELITTFNLDRLDQVKSLLEQHEIKYITASNTHDSLHVRGLTGTQNQTNNSTQYILYVNKKDLQKAKHITGIK